MQWNYVFIDNTRRSIILLLTILFLLITPFCYAAPLAGQEDHRYQARQKSEQSAKREAEKDVFLQPESNVEKMTLFPEEPVMFPIRQFILEGGEKQKFAWIQKELDTHRNQRIGKTGLRKLVQQINAMLLDKGYATTHCYFQWDTTWLLIRAAKA